MIKTMTARTLRFALGATLVALFLISSAARPAGAVTVTTDLDGSLVKASLPDVYFVGTDNKRYVFPNEKVFFSWYHDFSTVKTVTEAEMAAFPIGGNVTYRPGTRLIKIQTDTKVYAVGVNATLHWVSSEALAKQLYGDSWAKKVDDVLDTYFINYKTDTPIQNANDYNPTSVKDSAPTISFDQGATSVSGSQPTTNQGTATAFKIVSVDVAKADGKGNTAEDIRTFRIIFSRPITGARLTVTEKVSGTVFYNEPIAPDSLRDNTAYVMPSPAHAKLKSLTVYAWKVVAYAVNNATAAQTDIMTGEFMTTEFTATVSEGDNPNLTAEYNTTI